MKLTKVKRTKEQERPILTAHTMLIARHLDKDGNELGRRIVKDRVVTSAFVDDLVDVLVATTGDVDTIDSYKSHDSGTNTTGSTEAAADTALKNPCGEARDSGTQVEGTATNIYKSVATHTYAATFSITEHGIFNATAAGTLMDRTVFTAINVGSGDKIEFTFTITFSSGG